MNTEEYTNICCYCSGGCGVICSTRDGELINIEGDPDHPVNQGGLCPKGATMFQLRNVVDPSTREVIKNPNRRTVRWFDAPALRVGGYHLGRRRRRDSAVVKKTRDETFETVHDGITVNRCHGIASLGGSQQNSEEEYLINKMMRSLGVIAIDNQARV